jgi:hypothetical protein
MSRKVLRRGSLALVLHPHSKAATGIGPKCDYNLVKPQQESLLLGFNNSVKYTLVDASIDEPIHHACRVDAKSSSVVLPLILVSRSHSCDILPLTRKKESSNEQEVLPLTRSDAVRDQLEQMLTAYDRWLDRQPLAANTRNAYRLQVHQYGAYLAELPPEEDDPLTQTFARDYGVPVATGQKPKLSFED